MQHTKKTQISKALGAVVIGSFTAASFGVNAMAFSAEKLDSGYMQIAQEAKCGGDKANKEGKCGEDKAKAMKEGKCGEGKCGGDKAKAMKEGKCGEGKCGGDKAKAMKEGKCGGDKAKKEGKCGSTQ